MFFLTDRAVIFTTISPMLESYGYVVTCAPDGETAMELLSASAYHLILLDINLPDMTGFELCRELRRLSTVPVLFASARTNETDRITGFDIGGDDYLPKPYSQYIQVWMGCPPVFP